MSKEEFMKIQVCSPLFFLLFRFYYSYSNMRVHSGFFSVVVFSCVDLCSKSEHSL